MSKVKAWSITDQNVVVNYNGETHIVRRSDALADRLIKALKEGREREIPGLVSTAKRIQTFSKGAFVVENGRVVVNGSPAPQVLSDKIVRFSNDGLPFQPLLRFAEKLQENPSFRAVNELYQFLEKNDHPVTETGNFIAYKRVRSNFKDIHSGTFDNSVGKLVEVSRNQVDEDSSRTCSYGLHVANWDYAHTQFGSNVADTDIMLEVEVNPADVVAIPSDYNQSKMRVCRYKVLGVVTTPFDPETSLRVVDQNRFDQDVADLDKEDTSCVHCGGTVYDGDEVCSDCGDDSCEECGDYECDGECSCCEECGNVVSSGESICSDCEDEYPYEDELK
jgi:hypothetical protein